MTILIENQKLFNGITGGHTPAVDILLNSKPPELVTPAAAQLPIRDRLGHDSARCECKDVEACLDRRGF